MTMIGIGQPNGDLRLHVVCKKCGALHALNIFYDETTRNVALYRNRVRCTFCRTVTEFSGVINGDQPTDVVTLRNMHSVISIMLDTPESIELAKKAAGELRALWKLRKGNIVPRAGSALAQLGLRGPLTKKQAKVLAGLLITISVTFAAHEHKSKKDKKPTPQQIINNYNNTVVNVQQEQNRPPRNDDLSLP